MALAPKPVIGTAKVWFMSALVGLFTVNVAVAGNGQRDGAAPNNDGGLPKGSHGQIICGVNETVIEQDWPGVREKLVPGEVAHVSCSEKFGRPLKSLSPGNRGSVSKRKFRVRPLRVE